MHRSFTKTIRPTLTFFFTSVNLLALPIQTLAQDKPTNTTPPTAEATTVPPPAEPTKPMPSPEALTKGKELLTATIKAHGGETFLTLKSLISRGSGRLITPPEQGSFEVPIDSFVLTSVAPDKMHLALTTGFGDLVIGAPGNGKPSWLSLSGQVQEMPGEGDSLDPSGLLLLAAKGQLTAAALTDDEIQKRLETKTEVKKPTSSETPATTSTTPPDATTAPSSAPPAEKPVPKLNGFLLFNEKGKTWVVLVDAATNLIYQVEKKNQQGVSKIFLSDYKKQENGLLLPTRLRSLINGQELFNLTFSAIEMNKPIDDKLFAKP